MMCNIRKIKALGLLCSWVTNIVCWARHINTGERPPCIETNLVCATLNPVLPTLIDVCTQKTCMHM